MNYTISEEPRALSLQEMEETNGGGDLRDCIASVASAMGLLATCASIAACGLAPGAGLAVLCGIIGLAASDVEACDRLVS